MEMGRKRKFKESCSVKSSGPAKRSRPSDHNNSAVHFQNRSGENSRKKRQFKVTRYKLSFAANMSRPSTASSVKKKFVKGRHEQSSDRVDKHKRKRTSSGCSGADTSHGEVSGTLKGASGLLSTQTNPTVIAKNSNRRKKKRKEVPENLKSPSKCPVSGDTVSVQRTGKTLKQKNGFSEKVAASQVIKEKADYPKIQEDLSCNWKQLQLTLQKSSVKKLPHSAPDAAQAKSRNQKSKHSPLDRRETKVKEKEREPKVWFDDVDDILIDSMKTKVLIKPNEEVKEAPKSSEVADRDPLVKPHSFTGLTKVVAMDCEMVGVGDDGKDSVLARVSIVNQYGQCIYDKFVMPTEEVTDYRTHVSGIRPRDLEKGESFQTVQKEVHDIMKGRTLVGHALHNDLQVLFLDHPRKKIRDTARYKPFRKLFGGGNPALKKLVDKVLGVKVQEGEHNSVQDAQAAMRLYTMYRKQWEKDVRTRAKGLPSGSVDKRKPAAGVATTS